MPRPLKWKKTLGPFEEHYLLMLRSIHRRVAGMSEQQFAELQRSVNGPTNTNCGWTLYAVMPLVKDAIKDRVFRSKKEGQ